MTPKQEAFARAYVETGLATEAYRKAYSTANMAQRTLEVEASRLLAHPEVSLRVSQLQVKVAEKHNVTMDSILAELEEARKLAIANPRSVSAAVSASMGKAKIAGLIVDRAEHTGANGAPLVPVLNVGLTRN